MRLTTSARCRTVFLADFLFEIGAEEECESVDTVRCSCGMVLNQPLQVVLGDRLNLKVFVLPKPEVGIAGKAGGDTVGFLGGLV